MSKRIPLNFSERIPVEIPLEVTGWLLYGVAARIFNGFLKEFLKKNNF